MLKFLTHDAHTKRLADLTIEGSCRTYWSLLVQELGQSGWKICDQRHYKVHPVKGDFLLAMVIPNAQ